MNKTEFVRHREWLVVWSSCLLAFVLLFWNRATAGETNDIQVLAQELAAEGRHEASAIEYRRLALSESQAERRAGYYWAAAYEYVQQKDFDLASRMLDRVDENSQRLATPSLLLRAEAAIRGGRSKEAAFYYQSMLSTETEDASGATQTNLLMKSRVTATRRLSRTLALTGDLDQSRQTLAASPSGNSAGIMALDRYARGHDKKPWLGGLLGTIPGLGYAYSGEYGNAFRSLILNGLFIYAMADTADKDQWGAFAAITFFEITWYTGSIYGGVDAAERYNRDRLNECLNDIDRDSGFSADLRQIPLVTLRFEF